MERNFNKEDLGWIASSLKEKSVHEVFYQGDLADCGNEIGYIVGKRYPDLTEEEITDFIHGLRHGFSLTNGTH